MAAKRTTGDGKLSPLTTRQSRAGWLFVCPSILLLLIFLFYPMVKGLFMSFQTKSGYSLFNYRHILKDSVFAKSIGNTLFYVVIELGLMLPLAMLMAAVLQQKNLKFRGIYRVLLFAPCTMALMSYATVFKIMFGNYGLVNALLVRFHILSAPYQFLNNKFGARLVIAICLIWRWSGYNMVYYCTGFANIDQVLYEAAEIDGANTSQRFFLITLPLLKPIILLTMITSVNGTLQILDEINQLTTGGPANSTMSISLHIYNTAFSTSPKMAYACAMAFVLLIAIAILTAIQMKVGDKREDS